MYICFVSVGFVKNLFVHLTLYSILYYFLHKTLATIFNGCIYVIDYIICYVRSCGEGLVLSSDGKGCVDKNECLYFPCRNGGSCVNREPGYRCHCPEGFWGENCELVQEGRTLKLSMGALAAILVCLLIIMSEQSVSCPPRRLSHFHTRTDIYHPLLYSHVICVYYIRRIS